MIGFTEVFSDSMDGRPPAKARDCCTIEHAGLQGIQATTSQLAAEIALRKSFCVAYAAVAMIVSIYIALGGIAAIFPNPALIVVIAACCYWLWLDGSVVSALRRQLEIYMKFAGMDADIFSRGRGTVTPFIEGQFEGIPAQMDRYAAAPALGSEGRGS